MALRTILALALAAGGLSQTDQDARALLQGVANASSALTTFRAEGRIDQDLDIGLGSGQRTLRFRVATREPRQARIEISGGEEWMTGLPFLAVCRDGGAWLYLDKVKMYERLNADAAAGYCASAMLTDFSHVADDVTSAAVIGPSRAHFEGRDQTCTDVEAHYRLIKELMVPPGMVLKLGRVTRRMCIDRARNLILRDRFEADTDAGPDRYHIIQTVTYDRIDRNPPLSAALFDFQPPRNARLKQDPMPPPVAPPPSLPPGPRARVMTMPTPVERKEPEYTQEAWDEGTQGAVVLLVAVDENGAVGEIRTRQGLGYGLDEKAIEAVRSWRFNPATDDGQPIKGTAWVELRFTLPEQRPARASDAPVTRPAVPPRLLSVELRGPTDLENFLYLIALNFKAPQVCDKISRSAAGGGGAVSPRGYQISSMRSSCYRSLAWDLHDPKLCDQVIPVKTAALDGSRMDKAYCLEGVSGNGGGDIAVPHPFMEPFVRYMRLLGYNDARVAADRYDENPHNTETQAVYERLRTDKTFIERLQTAPNFFEPRSADKLRPARAVEFLYQMVAIDMEDANLCAKVSPNATFIDLSNRTALLRSRCFVSIAYNTKNDTLCAQLPRIGTFPHVNDQYDSLEACGKTVAIYRRPDFSPGGVRYGPSAFPRPSDFQDALHQISYRQDARSRVPGPTPEDYWQFLSRISRQGSDDDRRELLRKVLAFR
jgi:TonB family protein